MNRYNPLSPKERKKRLILLIKHAKETDFNPLLIQEYETQLIEVKGTLSQEKAKKEQFKLIEVTNE